MRNRTAGPVPGEDGPNGLALSCAHPHPAKGVFVRRTRTLALAVLALLNVFTLAAGLAVARMLPPRLALLRIPVTAARPVVNATPVLVPVDGPATRLQGTSLPTAQGLAAMLGARLPSA